MDVSRGQVPYLNVGCGNHFHPAWTNLDLQARPGVIQHDLRARLPFPEATFEAVYHSHVLEHLPRTAALKLLQECARVLRPGGVIRVAAPDLERIARLYIKYLDQASQGDLQAAAAYDWIVLELLDQMVRTRSGGEMLAYWKQPSIPARDLVVERVGSEFLNFLAQERSQPSPPPDLTPPSDKELLAFLKSGELHKWMYDRFSLGRLLTQAGFVEVRQCSAAESAIPRFREFLLDKTADGKVRKPDSLFMEARKPAP
jgi:SAM-dependent methyltransferase